MFLLQKVDNAFAPRDERTRCVITFDAGNVNVTVKQTHFIYKYFAPQKYRHYAQRVPSCLATNCLPSETVDCRPETEQMALSMASMERPEPNKSVVSESMHLLNRIIPLVHIYIYIYLPIVELCILITIIICQYARSCSKEHTIRLISLQQRELKHPRCLDRGHTAYIFNEYIKRINDDS